MSENEVMDLVENLDQSEIKTIWSTSEVALVQVNVKKENFTTRMFTLR